MDTTQRIFFIRYRNSLTASFFGISIQLSYNMRSSLDGYCESFQYMLFLFNQKTSFLSLLQFIVSLQCTQNINAYAHCICACNRTPERFCSNVISCLTSLFIYVLGISLGSHGNTYFQTEATGIFYEQNRKWSQTKSFFYQ